MRRELPCIDRCPETLPKVPDGADMIFVGMGDEDAFDPIRTLFQPCHISKNQIDAG